MTDTPECVALPPRQGPTRALPKFYLPVYTYVYPYGASTLARARWAMSPRHGPGNGLVEM